MAIVERFNGIHSMTIYPAELSNCRGQKVTGPNPIGRNRSHLHLSLTENHIIPWDPRTNIHCFLYILFSSTFILISVISIYVAHICQLKVAFKKVEHYSHKCFDSFRTSVNTHTTVIWKLPAVGYDIPDMSFICCLMLVSLPVSSANVRAAFYSLINDHGSGSKLV